MLAPRALGVDRDGKRLCLLAVASFEDWPPSLPFDPPGFGVFVASDVPAPAPAVLIKFATIAIDQGCACVGTWGAHCERLHDIFDEVDIAKAPDRRPRTIG